MARLDGGGGDAKKIATAAKVLDEGGLVGFPTETVYGIGCAVRRESVGRLDEVRGQRGGKPYTLHIGKKDDVFRYVPNITARGRKLIERYWPGPLTLVFELDESEWRRARLTRCFHTHCTLSDHILIHAVFGRPLHVLSGEGLQLLAIEWATQLFSNYLAVFFSSVAL